MAKVKGKVRSISAGKVVVFTACGLLALMIILGLGGFASPFTDTEITRLKPYADFVGREYGVTSSVSAYAWNDFPDKAKVVSISLIAPPGGRQSLHLVRDTLTVGSDGTGHLRLASLRTI
jgi:hypothetical protein